MFQALQEPDVNLCELFNTFYSITFFKSLSDSKDTKISWICQLLLKFIKLRMIVADKAVHALSNHAETFLYHFLK